MKVRFLNTLVGRTRRLKAARSLWLAPLLWAAAVATPSASGQTNLDVTFFLASDLHYGYTDGTIYSTVVSEGTLDCMNALPGQNYPASAGGGTVACPRGVLLIGDLTESGDPADWNTLTNDWGLNGERRLHFPVYEGFGNHDCQTLTVPQSIQARNPFRTGVSNISTNGYHYSWDWDTLHLVCLNLYPGQAVSGCPTCYPRDSLDFLADDLAQNVGNSGRPVVLYHHYGFDDFGLGWWSDAQRSAYLQIITNYNVIAIFAGHNHLVDYIPWQGLNTYNDGTAGKTLGPGYIISFLVAHVTSNNLAVVERLTNGAWGHVFNASITTSPQPSIVNNPASTTAPVGSAATLAVVASGRNLNYQWLFNGTIALPGATNSVLSLTNLSLSQSGAYVALVTNFAGVAVSQPATLEVSALLTVNPVPGVTLSGDIGSSLNLEFSDTLAPAANWQPLATVTLTNTPQVYVDSSTPPPGQRFYRAVSPAAPLGIAAVPAVTVFGDVGDSLCLEGNDPSDPTANWQPLATFTLTNTSQLYIDLSAPSLSRIYRAIPAP